MKLKKIRNLLCIAVLLIAAAGTFVLFAYPRFVKPVVKYNEAQSLYESGDYLRAAMKFPHWAGSVIRRGKRLMRGVLPVKLRLHAEMPKRHMPVSKARECPKRSSSGRTSVF